MIDALRKDFGINLLCKALNVPKSSYYYWKANSPITIEKRAKFFQAIVTVYAESHGIYGAPKITSILNSKNIRCSRSTVSRAMAQLGIRSIVQKRFPKRKSTLTESEKLKIVNLIKDFNFTKINQVWTTDITYIQTINEGTFYLISFIDYFSKKVVAWGLYTDQKTDKILDVLKKAIKARKPDVGLIVHSDKGSVYRSANYRKFLSKKHLVFSYTSLGHSCDENAAQESFHASLKKEFIYQRKLYTYEDAYRAIYEYIEGFYNPIRIHSSIGYVSPVKFEKGLS